MSGNVESARLALIARKLRTFRRLTPFVTAWIAPIWLMIGASSALICWMPFRHIAPRLGSNLGAVAYAPLIDAAQQRRALQIKTAIAIAAKYAPFRSDCFPTAIVAQTLCRLYGIPSAMHFGATLNAPEGGGRRFKAHAWVISGPVALSGGYMSFHRYEPVGCFVWPALVR